MINAKIVGQGLLMTVNEMSLHTELTGDEPEVYVERFRQYHYDYFGDMLSPDAELIELHQKVEELLAEVE